MKPIRITAEEAARDFHAIADKLASSGGVFIITDKQGNVMRLEVVAKPVRKVHGQPVYRYEDADKIGVAPA